MTTALSVLQRNELQLTELEQMILEESAQDTASYDPIPTKITIAPGGINVFSTSDGETMKSIKAIIAVSQKARAYWPEKGTGSPPMCASQDGSHGVVAPEVTDAQYRAAITARDPHPVIRLMDANKPIPQFFDCATCPLAQWGSVHQGGATGKSQACKSLRRLVVLIDGWAQPALLTLPPTSLRNFDLYASGKARRKAAYWAGRTKITLEAQKSNNGEPYSVAAFAGDSPFEDKAELMAVIEIRRQFSELVRGMPIESSEYEVVDGGDTDPRTVDPDTGEIADPPF